MINLTEKSRIVVSFSTLLTVAVGAWYLRGIHHNGEHAVKSLNGIQKDITTIRAEVGDIRTAIYGHEIRINTLEDWRRNEQLRHR